MNSKFNDDKTESLLTASNRTYFPNPPPTSIHIGNTDIPFSLQAKNLGITLSNNLSMENHVTNVCRFAYVELQRISNIRYYLATDATKNLVCAFILLKLDYCNSLLSSCSNQLLQNCKRSKIMQQDLSSKLGSKNASNPFFKNPTGHQSTQESSTKSQPCATILSLKLAHSICLNS